MSLNIPLPAERHLDEDGNEIRTGPNRSKLSPEQLEEVNLLLESHLAALSGSGHRGLGCKAFRKSVEIYRKLEKVQPEKGPFSSSTCEVAKPVIEPMLRELSDTLVAFADLPPASTLEEKRIAQAIGELTKVISEPLRSCAPSRRAKPSTLKPIQQLGELRPKMATALESIWAMFRQFRDEQRQEADNSFETKLAALENVSTKPDSSKTDNLDTSGKSFNADADALLAKLERETPKLDKQSPLWVSNRKAAEIEVIKTDTLGGYRADGVQTADRDLGRDLYGRVWRREGTPKAHPWYLRSTLRKETGG